MSYKKFVINAYDRWKISREMIQFYHTLKYNYKMFQELKDDLNMDELVIHDDEIAHVYIMHPSINGVNQTFLTQRKNNLVLLFCFWENHLPYYHFIIYT